MKAALCNEVTIEYAASRLARYVRKHRVKAELDELVQEKIPMDVFERILRKARARINEAEVDPKTRFKEAIRTLEDIIAETDNEKTLLSAQNQLAELLGIGAKWKQDTNTPEDRARMLREAMSAIDSSMDSNESESEAETVLGESD